MDAWLEIGLLQIGLSNAAIATALAALACVATRVCRRPQVALALWLLVPAKLVSPPLMNLGWPLIPSLATSEFDSPKKAARSPIALPLVLEDASTPTSNVVVLEDHAEDAELLLAPADVGAFVVAPHWVALAGRVWLAGSVLWIALAVIRTRRFRRVLRHAQPASPEVCDEVARLAKKSALRRPPQVRLVHRRVGPLVWALAGRATILLPTELMDRLTPDQRGPCLRTSWRISRAAIIGCIGLSWQRSACTGGIRWPGGAAQDRAGDRGLLRRARRGSVAESCPRLCGGPVDHG